VTIVEQFFIYAIDRKIYFLMRLYSDDCYVPYHHFESDFNSTISRKQLSIDRENRSNRTHPDNQSLLIGDPPML